MDSEPLEDSWRLRVTSAQVWFIMKNRNMEQFERVMSFLETTYRLLPRLVSPIKHMKIMFGLKTIVIMGMLREGRGLVDIVFKINQFFPSHLPQYQEQCSRKEMFLMRKNHLDFRGFAQTLAMNKDKLEYYVKNQMEEHYGEHYAQKVEDRLLHYLHSLEAVLPGDTYIVKLQKKERPLTEDEKLLLEVVTSDSTTKRETLKKLLSCDDASCHPERVPPSSGHGNIGTTSSQLTISASHDSSLSNLPKPVDAQSDLIGFSGGTKTSQEVARESHSLFDNESEVGRNQKGDEHCDVVMRVEEEASPPQFCSKHQRWVKSILHGCTDECSEDLQALVNVSTSPVMFQSSPSGSSSEDLTPSDLIPLHSDLQQTTQVSKYLHAATKATQHTAVQLSPASLPSAKDTCQTEHKSSKLFLTPVVRLIDIASVAGYFTAVNPHQASQNHNQPPSPSESNSTNEGMVRDSTFAQQETMTSRNSPHSKRQIQTASATPDASASTDGQTQSQHCSGLFNKGPWRLETFMENPSVEPLHGSCPIFPEELKLSGPSSQSCSPSTSQSGKPNSVCTAYQIPLLSEPSQQVPHQNIPRPHPQTQISNPETTQCFSVSLPVSLEASRVQRAQIRISPSSQAVLLQSKLLQPSVSLVRLGKEECSRIIKRRSTARHVDPPMQSSYHETSEETLVEEEQEDADCSFDLNCLYSSFSSSSEGDDSINRDPNYKHYTEKNKASSRV